MVAARCATGRHSGNEATGRLGSHGCGGSHHAGGGGVQRGHGIDWDCPDVACAAEGSLVVPAVGGDAFGWLGKLVVFIKSAVLVRRRLPKGELRIAHPFKGGDSGTMASRPEGTPESFPRP